MLSVTQPLPVRPRKIFQFQVLRHEKGQCHSNMFKVAWKVNIQVPGTSKLTIRGDNTPNVRFVGHVGVNGL